jgi:hypothetical protein
MQAARRPAGLLQSRDKHKIFKNAAKGNFCRDHHGKPFRPVLPKTLATSNLAPGEICSRSIIISCR